MKRKKILNVIVLFAAIMLVGLLWACGEDSASDDNNVDSDSSTTPVGDWLARKIIPDSQFKPPVLEGAVDALVVELNKTSNDGKMKLSFMPKELIGFWERTIDGAKDAFNELKVVSTTVAPADGEDDVRAAEQVDFVQERIDQGYSGIGIASLNDALVPAIDAAVDAGMTIITFDSDEPTSKRQLYLGTINTEAGKTGGETLSELLGTTKGTVIVLGFDDPEWQGGYDRTHEARKVLEAAGQTVSVYHTDWTDQSLNEAGMQAIMETADPPIVGCIGVFSNSHLCASAAEKAGVSDIKVAAFDFEAETLAFMESGKIQATHVQRQYYMGYVIPYLLYASKVLGIEQTKALISDIMVDSVTIDTGLDVVSGDTLDAYYTFLSSLSI